MVPALNQLFSYPLFRGFALPLGMTKDSASGIIKQSMSAERRTLLRTLGADPLQDDTLPPCWT